MAEVERTLVVMRHAKAERVGPSDFERELSDRGYGDAAAAGAWLAEVGVQPDQALVSAAARTEQTWQHASRGAGWAVAPTLDEGLYAADVDTALDLVRALDDAATSVVVVGHNPTMAYLAQLLDDGEGNEDAANEMAVGTFPTSATAVFTLTGPWRDIGASRATLTAYHVGRR